MDYIRNTLKIRKKKKLFKKLTPEERKRKIHSIAGYLKKKFSVKYMNFADFLNNL